MIHVNEEWFSIGEGSKGAALQIDDEFNYGYSWESKTFRNDCLNGENNKF